MRTARRTSRPGFTLIELLMVVVVLGLAGALIVPAMGQTGVLRVQAAVRTLVSDITFIQSDAAAFQERRAIMFDTANSTYRLLTVPGNALDPTNNTMFDPSRPNGLYVVDFNDARFGGARLTDVNFDGQTSLIFDGMGGPVANAAGNAPGNGGAVVITGSGSSFTITVEAFTGRITVQQATAQIEDGGLQLQPLGGS